MYCISDSFFEGGVGGKQDSNWKLSDNAVFSTAHQHHGTRLWKVYN